MAFSVSDGHVTAPYRDGTDGLRARLEEATRAEDAASARAAELEAELALATGPRTWRARVLGFVVVAVASAGLGVLAMQFGRSAERSALENRIQSSGGRSRTPLPAHRVRDIVHRCPGWLPHTASVTCCDAPPAGGAVRQRSP